MTRTPPNPQMRRPGPPPFVLPPAPVRLTRRQRLRQRWRDVTDTLGDWLAIAVVLVVLALLAIGKVADKFDLLNALFDFK